ncbi:hypothetical protein ABW16_21455 [Mycolicibacter heraklionensis]|uniref:Uncharacterized protein n=1 Tax=Mycolicibacter heraklionensis TaxID=512402 RepID=A0ABR5FA06_9MYCO|nr:hypothetical protein [Mycolicibacter heraklionensis]KLO25883.1 hypothetical protein ABW16_21455 [Mycolicibacter heraklionensis]
MSDPAVEAAQRHADTLPYGAKGRLRGDDLIAAAREALKPVRAVVEEWRDQMPLALWEELATRIYTTEELNRDR